MKTNLIFASLVYAFSLISFAQTFEKVGIPLMKQAVQQSFAPTPQSKECNAGGSLDYDNLALDRGGVMSSESILSSLIQKIEGNRNELLQDSSHCGACQQVNQVAIFTTTQPEKTDQNSFCDNRPTVNIQKELRDEEIQSFASSTIRGKTPEGQELYKGCPDPCSFYIASATTPMGNGNSLLNLTVQCGQPRAGSMFFAKFKFSSGLIHKWSCQ